MKYKSKKSFISKKTVTTALFGIPLFLISVLVFQTAFQDPSSIIRSTSLTEAEIELKAKEAQRKIIADQLGDLFKKNQLLPDVEFQKSEGAEKEKVRVVYTLNEDLQKEANKLLQLYRPDYGTIVAIDPSTGKVLAMVSYEGATPSAENWALKASFPAASIFKVITASAALEKYKISPELELSYSGPNYTLYKKNLFSEKTNRWSRSISFKEAFARSINIFFGKLSLKYMQPGDLMEYASKYMFNRDLPTDLPVEKSNASLVSEDPYDVAEMASGFTDNNTLSPLHGAMVAASIAYDGVMKAPYIVERIENANDNSENNGEVLYQAESIIAAQPVNTETAEKLRLLMMETVESGTSRKSFRELSRSKKFQAIEMGGKTGHLTGTNPKGKTDWFVGYGRLGNRVVSVAAVTVNKQYWRVKSAYLAQRMIRKFFETPKPVPPITVNQ